MSLIMDWHETQHCLGCHLNEICKKSEPKMSFEKENNYKI